MRAKNQIIFVIGLLCTFESSGFLSAQTIWSKDALNPILQRDTVIANLPNDLITISDCWVIKLGSVYKMWYTCGGLNYPSDTLLRSRLCYAFSTDGTNWTKYDGNPVLDVSYNGGWDSLGIETATVLIDSSAPLAERYKMWFAGQYFNSYRYDIGYAFSPDGINWIKHPEPVLQVGMPAEWDNGFLEGPSVLKDEGIYKMWYCGYDAVVDGNSTDGHANIGYATSTDGLTWFKYAGNPILTTVTNSWESINVQDPHVIKQGNEFLMWYGGGASDSTYDQQVGFATSNDGVLWSKSTSNPVLYRGNSGAWDDHLASFPSVLNDDGFFKMWYTGRDEEPLSGSLNYFWEIGYATAPVAGINSFFKNVNENMKIYPNPVQDHMAIQFPFEVSKGSLKIYDILSQLKFSISNINTKTLTINTINLTSGVYVIVFQNSDKLLIGKCVVSK